MKALFTSADEYLCQSSWKDLAVLKLCLLSLGLLIGMEIPKRGRKETRIAAALLFAATYIPLMVRYLRILLRTAREEA